MFILILVLQSVLIILQAAFTYKTVVSDLYFVSNKAYVASNWCCIIHLVIAGIAYMLGLYS